MGNRLQITFNFIALFKKIIIGQAELQCLYGFFPHFAQQRPLMIGEINSLKRMVVFGSRAGYSGSFCEKLLEASPVPEPVPAGSKIGPLQATSETISDGGSDSGITDIRKKIVIAQKLLRPEKIVVRVCESNNSADSQVSAVGGRRGVPGTGAELPLQCLGKTW